MIKVLFFAQLRELLETEGLEVEEDVKTVGELRQHLLLQNPQWKAHIMSQKCLVAVNQSICDDTTVLNRNDEVAFFPPVTGG